MLCFLDFRKFPNGNKHNICMPYLAIYVYTSVIWYDVENLYVYVT